MENSTIVVDFRPFDKIGRVDEYFGSELDPTKNTLSGHTINFEDDIVASDLVGAVDVEAAVVVGEVTVCLDDLFFDPSKEARLAVVSLCFKSDS